jgi:hypothetical protein
MLRSCALLALVVLPRLAEAQTGTPGTEPGAHVSPAVGVHYGSPIGLSAAAGLLIEPGRDNDGIVVTAEVGQQGGRVTLGYFRMFGWFASGYSLRAAVLRTADQPTNATEHTTYVGLEAHGMLIFGVGARVGYMRRASHSGTDPFNTIVPFSVSIGF